MAYPAKYPSLNATELTDEAKDILVRVIRVAFPHPSFPDGPYERTADTILDAATADTWARVTLTQGLLTLTHVAGGDFRDLDDDQATSVLRRIETTEFFGFVRRTTVLNLYDNEDVWEVLGYEGPSFDKGGYVHRGFDDLDWLPTPRIESYDGPKQLVEVADPVPFAAGAPVHQPRDTSSQPGNRPAVLQEVAK
jgi:hypothetical protein